MKKHHVALIVVSANFIIFSTYLSLWLGSETYDAKEDILFPILIVSYIMPITLIGLFILLSKALESQAKDGMVGLYHSYKFYWLFSFLFQLQNRNQSNCPGYKQKNEGGS